MRQHHRCGRAQSRAALVRVRRPRVRWRERPADARKIEKLKGANAFIGNWNLACADCVGPSESGTLSFLRDGDVELRSAAGQLVGVGAEPWSYKPREKGGSVVIVSFSLDVSGRDVLYFSGAVDAEGGPERRLEGSLKTGVGRKVGDFVATVIQ